MFVLFPWLAALPLIAPLAHPSHAVGVCLELPPAMPSIVADTTGMSEPPPVQLTDDLVTRYLAVRKEVFAIIEHDSALAAAIQQHRGHQYTIPLRGPGGLIQGQQAIVLPDFVALAAKTPAVAAIFTRHAFAPSQFAPVTITIREAQYAASLHLANGWAIKEPASVFGKNITFVLVHHQEFQGTGLGFNYTPQ